ncbi:cell wall-binding repeat-containing protein [Haloimpatiens sp. FM7330]|uniref:cell wall-binding repeat-containing protein n=1 Tax=Haloimpatiens sp. FM7330 TaxID=3298610 RepID=UPI00363AE207
MRKKLKSILSYVMIFLLACTVSIFNMPDSKVYAQNSKLVDKVNGSIEKTYKYIIKNGTWSSDWKTVAFNKSGLKLPNNYNKDYLNEKNKLLKESKGYFYKVTDYERITLGVVAAGGDPTNVGGYNLLDKIYNYHDSKKPERELDFQGLNGVIYGLIALDTKNYEIPKNAKYSRQYMLDYVLHHRNSDGGWDLNMNGSKSDVDITSMTLISLAPYHDYVSEDGKKVKDAIEEAVNWLSKVQRKDGGFNSWFTENNSESCAQTIIGLCANGIDPTCSKFTKDRNLVENLLRFQQSNGEFYHLMDGSEGVNGMSTEQAIQALISYRDFESKKGSIYWFDNKKQPETYKNGLGQANENKEDEKIETTDKDLFVVTGNDKVQRIYGKNRIQTSVQIAKELDKERKSGEKLSNVIVTSGYGFADALAGSVLSKKLDAPILLIGKNLNDSKDTVNYIQSNLDKNGKIFILGGNGVVSDVFVTKFKALGYKNIQRICGKNRIETCSKIVNEFNVKTSTPLVIVNGNSFADALSISAPAAIEGYPILLSNKTTIPENIKKIIKKVQPSKIFVIGGQGVLNNNIEKQAKGLCSKAKIVRLCGKDRYETSLKVNEFFNNGESIVLASGQNYPDALAGSALASKLNASLLLINDSSLNKQINFIDKNKVDSVFLLGGESVISKKVKNAVDNKITK